MTSPASRPGTVLGTAPYMSPEQTRAQELDERTDVWAFGCVVYEMLTGQRAFPGATFPEVAASILEKDPDFAALPESTPFVLLRLLRRCLRRDKDERLRDIADAGLEMRELLQEVSSGAPVVSMGSGAVHANRTAAARRRSWGLVVAGILLVAALGTWPLLSRLRRTSADESRQPRFETTLPRGVRLVGIGFPQNPLALSPYGQRLAFVGCSDGACQIYLRERHEIDARPLAGTEDGRSPFFSPDGRWIGFGAGGKLKKIALDGGAIVTLSDAPQFRGGSWGDDGAIVFNRGKGGLFQVAADGGEPREVTNPDPARRERNHRWPQHIPGSTAVLFDVTSETFEHSVAVVALETGQTRILADKGGTPRWSTTGHVLYGQGGIVYAAPFDVRRLELSGPAVPVLEGVAMFSSPGEVNSAGGNVYYALAPDGTLVFSPREARFPKRTLVWVDRHGQRVPVTPRQQNYVQALLSPDGTRIATSVGADTGPLSLILDLRREAWAKVSMDEEAGTAGTFVASWMPDGTRVLVRTTQNEARLFLVQVDDPGSAELLHAGETQLLAAAPDGRSLLFCAQIGPAEWDIWRLALDGSLKVEPFLVTPEREVDPSFSPDGRFVAYRSDESGRPEVYVRPYAGAGPRHMVSTQGGGFPRWSRDGREIFFTSRGAMTSAAVHMTPSFRSDPPRKLFDVPEEVLLGYSFYDVTPDGHRFLMIERDPYELRPLGLVIVPNWTTDLKARLAAAGPRD